jgi:hypothetical protein
MDEFQRRMHELDERRARLQRFRGLLGAVAPGGGAPNEHAFAAATPAPAATATAAAASTATAPAGTSLCTDGPPAPARRATAGSDAP